MKWVQYLPGDAALLLQEEAPQWFFESLGSQGGIQAFQSRVLTKGALLLSAAVTTASWTLPAYLGAILWALAFAPWLAASPRSWISKILTAFHALGARIPLVILGPFVLSVAPISVLQTPKVSAAFLVWVHQGALWSTLLKPIAEERLQSPDWNFSAAKGIFPIRRWFHHFWRPAIGSVLHPILLRAAQLLGGSFLLETLFRLPGFGTFFWEAVQRRDLLASQLSLLCIALLGVGANALAELALHRQKAASGQADWDD